MSLDAHFVPHDVFRGGLQSFRGHFAGKRNFLSAHREIHLVKGCVERGFGLQGPGCLTGNEFLGIAEMQQHADEPSGSGQCRKERDVSGHVR